MKNLKTFAYTDLYAIWAQLNTLNNKLIIPEKKKNAEEEKLVQCYVLLFWKRKLGRCSLCVCVCVFF